MGDESDPFMEAGRSTDVGRVKRLADIVRVDQGQEAVDQLRDEFETTSKELSRKYEAEVERVSEEAYLRGVNDTIDEAIEFQNSYARIANQLIQQCYDENGVLDVDELNKRLAAIKDGRQHVEAMIDRVHGKAKVRTEQSGEVNVIHRMNEIANSLEAPDDFDYEG